jgi:hypothetical protein
VTHVTVTDAGRILTSKMEKCVKNSVVEISSTQEKAQVIPMPLGTLGKWTGSNK